MAEPSLFKIELKGFSESEKNAIEKLKEIGLIIHSIWQKQVNEQTGEILVYSGLSEEEIESASKDNEKILDPYTVVKKIDGKITAVSYKEEYATELKKISELLEQVAGLVKSPEEKDYFSGLADDYKKGDFDSALVRYIKNVDTKIYVLMGPIETYLDNLFGVKKVFQFNLRVLLEEETDETRRMVEIVKSKNIFRPSTPNQTEITPEDIKVSVSDVIMFAGRQAGSNPSSTNLPDDAELLKKYGAKIVFYRNSLFEKFENLLSVYLEKLVLEGHKIEKDNIKTAYYRIIALHEIVEGTIKYADFRDRLKGHTDSIREFNAFLLGLKNAKFMNISGYLSEPEFIDIMIALCIYGIDAVARRDKNPSVMEYAKGFAVLFNYGLQEGVFTIENKKLVIHPKRMNRMTALGSVILEIFANGDDSDVDFLYEKYGSFSFEKGLGI